MSTSSCERTLGKHLVCFGDSVTQGVPYAAPEDTFCALLGRRLHHRYSSEFDVCAFNAGVGGENTAEGLARIERDVLVHTPDLVVVEFGLNDIRYEPEKRVSEEQFAKNLRLMYTRLSDTGATVVFMTPNPIVDRFHVYSQNTDYYRPWGGCNGACAAYAQIIREVADALQAPLCDAYEAFYAAAVRAEFCGKTSDYRDLTVLASHINVQDGVHPTAVGHELIAAELYHLIVVGELLT